MNKFSKTRSFLKRGERRRKRKVTSARNLSKTFSTSSSKNSQKPPGRPVTSTWFQSLKRASFFAPFKKPEAIRFRLLTSWESTGAPCAAKWNGIT